VVVEVAKFEVLSRTPSAYMGKDRKLVESTFVVYKDAEGRVGTIVIGKKAPTDADVEAEVKKRAAS